MAKGAAGGCEKAMSAEVFPADLLQIPGRKGNGDCLTEVENDAGSDKVLHRKGGLLLGHAKLLLRKLGWLDCSKGWVICLR